MSAFSMTKRSEDFEHMEVAIKKVLNDSRQGNPKSRMIIDEMNQDTLKEMTEVKPKSAFSKKT